MSITIDSGGTARLYDGLNMSGSLLYEDTGLDMSRARHIRFMTACATSAGFPARDSSLNIYEFESVPEPATLSLLAFGGLGFLARRRRTRR